MWEYIEDDEFELPEQETIKITNCDIAVYKIPLAGSPNLLFVHGMGGCAAMNAPLLNALAQTFTVLTFDLPGHGKSELTEEYSVEFLAEIAVAVLRHFGVEQYYSMGHSMGCPIAAYASRSLECQGLIFSCPAGLRINTFKNVGQTLLMAPEVSNRVFAQQEIVKKAILGDMAKIKCQRILDIERASLDDNYDTYIAAMLKIMQQFGLNKHETLFTGLQLPFALILCENDDNVDNKYTERLLGQAARRTIWLEYHHQVGMEVPKLLAHVVSKIYTSLK